MSSAVVSRRPTVHIHSDFGRSGSFEHRGRHWGTLLIDYPDCPDDSCAPTTTVNATTYCARRGSWKTVVDHVNGPLYPDLSDDPKFFSGGGGDPPFEIHHLTTLRVNSP
uniref:DUF1996 domain-containing protein n=1 Tax=Mesocestoides corti TaxID=53468 RepID=A0A5K3FZU5_MESCO